VNVISALRFAMFHVCTVTLELMSFCVLAASDRVHEWRGAHCGLVVTGRLHCPAVQQHTSWGHHSHCLLTQLPVLGHCCKSHLSFSVDMMFAFRRLRTVSSVKFWLDGLELITWWAQTFDRCTVGF